MEYVNSIAAGNVKPVIKRGMIAMNAQEDTTGTQKENVWSKTKW